MTSPAVPHTIFRVSYNSSTLLATHPPKFRHSHKAALFELAYPDGTPSSVTLEVTRWSEVVPSSISFSPLSCEVRPGFYDYKPPTVPGSPLVWHVNFADPRLFVAYGSGLFAQDEMQVAEHPILASVREALLASGLPARTSDEAGATPVLVRNVERRLAIATAPDAAEGRPLGLYGNRFAAAPFSVVRRATRRVDPPTFSNVIAMAAPSGGRGVYTARQIAYIFTTAYTAFAAARRETDIASGQGAPCCVHTGFWGCGAFGGNRQLMIAVQALAAMATGISHLFVHAGDAAGAQDVRAGLLMANQIESTTPSPRSLETLATALESRDCRWGVSDGN